MFSPSGYMFYTHTRANVVHNDESWSIFLQHPNVSVVLLALIQFQRKIEMFNVVIGNYSVLQVVMCQTQNLYKDRTG